MKEPSIFLCPEISKENAMTLSRWLSDEEVARYLSDSAHVSRDIEQVISRLNLPDVTHLFNQNGRFYMLYAKPHTPLGFVRFIKIGREMEIVIVIGERSNWNRKFGVRAIRESMKMAFFEFRTEKLIAKIYKENIRSIRAFISAGFVLEKETSRLRVYSITMEHYLQLLKGAPAMSSEIFITSIDSARIRSILDKLAKDRLSMGNLSSGGPSPDHSVKQLERELERAVIVDPHHVPGDVITMNSRALLLMNDEEFEVSLVYPEEAELSEMKLSVFSPIGAAILGYKEGSTIEWEVPSGISKIHIKRVAYQPEANGIDLV